jgi:hypothetical protein
MPSLQPIPALQSDSGVAMLSFGTNRPHAAARSTWIIAIAAFLLADLAANLVCLSPRWYSGSWLLLAWQSLKMIALTAGTGASVVWFVWGAVADKPFASAATIARNLSTGWVFLPCYVLLYERDNPLLLLVTALITLGIALGLRPLLPAPAQAALLATPDTAILPSLDGLPPRDSPLLLATWIAILIQAACILAAADSLLFASLPLAAAVFLFAWRWSAFDPRIAQWWLGPHAPLRPAIAATVLTAMMLIPFTIGQRSGFYVAHQAAPRKPPPQVDSTSGYYGIILYPPPKKREIVAPQPHTDSFEAAARPQPVMIPFDGPYWYFTAPARRPGEKAHVARALPTDANVNPRSTGYQPIQMEAHQNLGLPVALSCCGEIALALTNADTRAGAMSLALMLNDSASPGKAGVLLHAQPIPSSEADPIPADRAPVKETLHFAIPPTHAQTSFNEISVYFILSPRHARAGAKVSIDSFELIPRH